MIAAAQRLVPQARFEEAPAEAVPFPDGTFDLVFLGLVLHEAGDALQALHEAKRLARLRVAVLEWSYQEADSGPPLADRLKPEQMIDLAQEAGAQGVETLQLAHTVLYRLS
jgi:ubiquinone/menaquinone biosynthesis C-methylase UbiE